MVKQGPQGPVDSSSNVLLSWMWLWPWAMGHGAMAMAIVLFCYQNICTHVAAAVPGVVEKAAMMTLIMDHGRPWRRAAV